MIIEHENVYILMAVPCVFSDLEMFLFRFWELLAMLLWSWPCVYCGSAVRVITN